MHSIWISSSSRGVAIAVLFLGQAVSKCGGEWRECVNFNACDYLEKIDTLRGRKRRFVSNVWISVRVYRFLGKRILENTVKIICDFVHFIA